MILIIVRSRPKKNHCFTPLNTFFVDDDVLPVFTYCSRTTRKSRRISSFNLQVHFLQLCTAVLKGGSSKAFEKTI